MGRPVQDGGACLRSRSAVTSDGGVQALVTTSEAPATDSAVESALGIEAQVDELFSKWDRPDTPGAALGVVRGGELVLERYYGCADLEHGVPLGPESVFDIASTSKQFTAASILLLAQRGQLSLDDEVQAYVPELPSYEQPITIRHLIHHTSGIRDYFALCELSGIEADHITTTEVLQLLERQRTLNFKPGTKHLYSNSGYILLGIIITRVTGDSLREFVRANITEPLQMSSSHFRDDPDEIVPGLVRMYRRDEEKGYKKAEAHDELVGDGALISSVRDLARWERNYIDQRVGGPDFTKQMETVGTPEGDKDQYAFGLGIKEHRGLRTVSHGGSLSGFSGQFLRFPEQELAVIVHSNVGGFDSAGIALKVADLYLADDLAPVADVGSGSGAEVQIEDLAGLYVDGENGLALDVNLKESELELVVGEIHLPLRHLHQNRFLADYEVAQYEIEFETADAQPAILKLIYDGEAVITATQIKREEGLKPDLSEYAGSYTSDELGVTYEVKVEGDALYVWRPRSGRGLLRPTVADEFAAPRGIVRFGRGAGGKVIQLIAETPRAAGLTFRRVD